MDELSLAQSERQRLLQDAQHDRDTSAAEAASLTAECARLRTQLAQAVSQQDDLAERLAAARQVRCANAD